MEDKEVIVNELLARAPAVGREELEQEIRQDLEYVDSDPESLRDYYMETGMEKIKERKEKLHKLSPLELEQSILKAQDNVANVRGQLGKQKAWEEYQSYVFEAKRRKDETVQQLKQNLLREGQEKRDREAQLESAYNQAQKEAEYAQRIAEQRKKEAMDRAEEMSRLQAEARSLRTKL